MPGLWIRKINSVKVAIVLIEIFRVNEIPIKIPAGFLRTLMSQSLQFTWKWKGPKQPTQA
jgi:hypothetical protein